MVQERISDRSKARLGLLRIGEYGLAAHVARGRDDRPAELGKQQVMQRTVGQERTHLGQAGRHRRRESRIIAATRQHDGPRRIEQRFSLDAAWIEIGAQAGESVGTGLRKHHRERLVRTTLAATQSLYGRFAARVTHQVVAADAAHGEHPARPQHRDGGSDCCIIAAQRGPARLDERQVRTTDGARDGLGMEAPVERVLVFAPARVAQREARHAGVRPVIRQRVDDRVARTALRAVDERIAVAPIGRVGKLAHAVVAREEIGRDGHLWRVRCAARGDGESRNLGRRSVGHGANHGTRERRRAIDDAGGKRSDLRRFAAHHDLHIATQVTHVAVEPELAREAVHERTETHPLHPAGHHDPAGDPACSGFAHAPSAPDALRPAHTFSRTPLAHQMRHAPSSETMHGPTGWRGVQARP